MFHLQINQVLVFTSEMFEKHLWWKSDILIKDAGHFTSKNQLPGLSVNGTLTENGLI